MEEIVQAVKENNIKLIKSLIKKGTDVNVADYEGNTALIEASYRNNLKIVKYLVENGADVNKVNKNERTSLIYAIENNNKNMVNYLVEHNADVNDQDIPPLLVAIEVGDLELVKILVQNGADIDEEILLLANEMGNKTIIKYLFEKPEAAKKIQRAFRKSRGYAAWRYSPERMKAEGMFDLDYSKGLNSFGKRKATLRSILSDIKYLKK
jgi:ankyrin repeat protein